MDVPNGSQRKCPVGDCGADKESNVHFIFARSYDMNHTKKMSMVECTPDDLFYLRMSELLLLFNLDKSFS